MVCSRYEFRDGHKGAGLMGVGRNFEETPAGQIIQLLQRRGELSIKEIENLLGVTTTSVRQQMVNLQAEGYVTGRLVRQGVGRPFYVYSPTERAHELFACHCDDLAFTLLEEMYALEGLDRVRLLLDRVSRRLAARYAQEVHASTLQERVKQLSRALDRQGIFTDMEVEGDVIMFKEYNCPYHDLAQGHRDVCTMEQKMMSQVLGSEVSLNQCMLDGHAGCEFVVKPNESPA
jgi:DeoR family transcriptional regulator, suf operon transcriptional repressor